MGATKISWADAVWNPVIGCSRASEGCRHCYAESFAGRLAAMGQERYVGLTRKVGGETHWTGEVRFVDSALDLPLRWRKPRRIFVNSMSDLFHEQVPDEWIDRCFAVMALTPNHVHLVLTKRAERMRAYLSDPETPGRVVKAADKIDVAREIAAMGEPRIEPIPGYPGYLVSDHGGVFTSEGSDVCVRCGTPTPDGTARRRYCGDKCRQADAWDRKMGRTRNISRAVFRPMKGMPGEDGHLRVMLYRDGAGQRELVHRLVLTVFDRPPEGDEEGCHRDGDPANNAVPNLRWGTRADNMADRRRHGNGRSWSKLTDAQVGEIRRRIGSGESAAAVARDFGISDTQARNIANGRQWSTEAMPWPLPNVQAGTSVEDQATADARIPHLLATPAAVRWVSLEPLLGAVNIDPRWLPHATCDACGGAFAWEAKRCPSCGDAHKLAYSIREYALRWLVIGGESGPGARPFRLAWARSVIQQCQSASVPAFMKQVGARPVYMPSDLSDAQFTELDASTAGYDHGPVTPYLRDRKGANPAEWPSDLRVREMPA